MPTIKARKIQQFIYEVVDPLQNYVRKLHDSGHPVEALYLASHVVKVAIRRGILRDLGIFIDESPGGANPIRIAIATARGAAAVRHFDLASLPAATSIMGLAPYFGLEVPSYEDIYDSDRFVTLSNRIVIEARKTASAIPNRIAAGMLASTARMAVLDGLPMVQGLVLDVLDAKSREFSVLESELSMEVHAVELGRAAKFARESGDVGSAIAFDVLGSGVKADQFVPVAGMDSDYFPISQQYRRMGQPGTAALLFETAIDGASTDSIARMVREVGPEFSEWAGSRRQRHAAFDTGGWAGSSPPVVQRRRGTKQPAGLVAPATAADVPWMVSSPTTSSDKRPRPSEQRHVNAWFEDGEQQLETDRLYRLAVNIGKPRPDSLATEPIVEPDFADGDTLELLVVIGGHGFSIKRHQRTLRLPRKGDSEIVRFEVTPRMESFLLRISVYVASDLTLVEEFEIPLTSAAHSRAA